MKIIDVKMDKTHWVKKQGKESYIRPYHEKRGALVSELGGGHGNWKVTWLHVVVVTENDKGNREKIDVTSQVKAKYPDSHITPELIEQIKSDIVNNIFNPLDS